MMPTMTSKVLIDVLIDANGKREGDVISMDSDADVTLFASVGNHTLTVDRIAAVECRNDVLIASTRKSDRFVLAYEDVRAVRIGAVRNKAGLRPAG